jgi:NSS family neurotransmitter:Na+ symporter
VILSFYSVVAGWALKYTLLAATGELSHGDPAATGARFGEVSGSGGEATLWHVVFMIMTIAIVLGGVQKGVERASRVMMPALFVLFVVLLLLVTRMSGFGAGVDFVFGFHTDKLTGKGVLEALGHSFFTLSVGMGAMLTYGSYLRRDDDIVGASLAISLLDTAVALMACLVLFPITFSYGMEPASGPGLVFQNIPMAFAQLPGSTGIAIAFFVLLVFAALTSSISMLEVVCSYFIDERGWSRKFAVPVLGGVITLLGVPSALAFSDGFFGAGMKDAIGKTWFEVFDYITSNWMLPLCGLGISVFAAFRIEDAKRRIEFATGSRLGKVAGAYVAWLQVLRYIVPLATVLIMLSALGIL